jgi:hypothetical protein
VHASLPAWEYRCDYLRIFDLHLAGEPALAVDGREIVAACFWDPQALLRTSIPSHIRRYLESN